MSFSRFYAYAGLLLAFQLTGCAVVSLIERPAPEKNLRLINPAASRLCQLRLYRPHLSPWMFRLLSPLRHLPTPQQSLCLPQRLKHLPQRQNHRLPQRQNQRLRLRLHLFRRPNQRHPRHRPLNLYPLLRLRLRLRLRQHQHQRLRLRLSRLRLPAQTPSPVCNPWPQTLKTTGRMPRGICTTTIHTAFTKANCRPCSSQSVWWTWWSDTKDRC
jgi:hypothetical protein